MRTPAALTLFAALQAANEICRSTYEIAAREGRKTNWPAFRALLAKQLEAQYAILTGPAEAAGFECLVEVMAAWGEHENVELTVAEEGMDEVDDAHTMLTANIEDGDGPAAMLRNLASLIVGAQRMAAVVMKDITPERLAAITKDYAL